MDQAPDRAVARLADAQHGVVARRQLLELGLTPAALRCRIRAGRLHRVHRGVYAVGYSKLSLKGHWMAAVLACGPNALLSHRTALGLWELQRVESGSIDVTVPGKGKPGPERVRVHSTRDLRDEDVECVDGIPVTSLARTVVDYAGAASPSQLRSVLEALERRGTLIGRELDAVLARGNGRKGTRTLKAVIAEMTGPAPWLQSELEAAFRELIRGSDIPEPEANAVVEGEVVDALWREERVIVELDGYAFHKTRARFEADRRRDAKLMVAGYRVLRITQRRLIGEPEAVLAEIRALLSAARASLAAAGR